MALLLSVTIIKFGIIVNCDKGFVHTQMQGPIRQIAGVTNNITEAISVQHSQMMVKKFEMSRTW
jgi:hypothetical protein